MAIGSSGAIRLGADIGIELDQLANQTIGLEDAATGGIDTINTASASYPNSSAPHLMSEWYSYDHDASAGFGGIFVDDFYTGGGVDIQDARVTYATTTLGDGTSFPTDGDGNTVTTRPIWTYKSGSGATHEGRDTMRVAYQSTHAQWRTTNVPAHSNFSGTMNIEMRLFMSSGSNKDITFMIDCISQGDAWSTSVLKDGYFFQLDDGSSQWIKFRRRNNNGSATTLATSSSGAFSKNTWFTLKITWTSSGVFTAYFDGVQKGTVTDTTFNDFCPSGGGLRFMCARYMTGSNYNEMDWIKVWKS